MKKKTLILLALFAGVLSTQADNTVTVSEALVPQGKTGTFSIDLANTDRFASSMEVHLTLPEGIAFVSVSLSDRLADNPSMGSTVNGQSVTITTLSTTNAAITGNSGPLLFITVSADASLEVGKTLTASITKMELAKKVGDKHEKFNPDPFDFQIKITDRVILDENSTIAPTAQSDANVLVKRTIKAGQWSTIVLPFLMNRTNAEKAFGSGYQLAEFDSFETDYGDDETNMTPLGIVINLKDYTIPARGGWAAGRPMLIKVAQDVESFELDKVTINSTVNDATKSDELNGLSGKLTGSFVKTVIPEDGLFINDNQFWYSTGKTAVKAFRCWFELDAVLDKETSFESRIMMNFIGDGSEATGILDNKRETMSKRQCYDLQGRRVEKPVKGMYVKDGKKVIIK